MTNRTRLCFGTLACFFYFNAQAAPVAVDDIRNIPANTPITIDVLSNDSDSAGLTPELDPQSVTQPAFGTVSVSGAGAVTYRPNPDFIGEDRFSYTIFTVDGGVTETATANVVISVNPAMAERAGMGSNMRSVAVAIERACHQLAGLAATDLPPASAALAARCEDFFALAAADPDAAQAVLREIAPEETLSIARLGVNALEFQSNMVGTRLNQLGRGLREVGAPKLSQAAFTRGGSAGDGSILPDFGVYTSAQIEDADSEETLLESGFGYRALSLTTGVDFPIGASWIAGGAFGYTANTLDFKQGGGDITADIVSAIFYAARRRGNLDVTLQTGVSHSAVDLAREIQYATLDGAQFQATTKGNTNGLQWFVTTEVQYQLSLRQWTINPSIRYQYMESTIDRYADTNAGGWEVILGEQQTSQSKLKLGLQATYALNTSWGVLVPTAEIHLNNDLDYDQQAVTGRLAFAPGDAIDFGLYSDDPDDLYYQAGIGCSAVLPRGVSAFVGFNQTLGYSHYTAKQVQAGFRMEF